MLHSNSKIDEELVVEDTAKEYEPEQTDTHYDFSFEEADQDMASDINELNISQQEDAESGMAEEEGYIEPSDFNDSVLNDYEIANRDLIVQYEEEMGYR